jgi:hypothetical protein
MGRLLFQGFREHERTHHYNEGVDSDGLSSLISALSHFSHDSRAKLSPIKELVKWECGQESKRHGEAGRSWTSNMEVNSENYRQQGVCPI